MRVHPTHVPPTSEPTYRHEASLLAKRSELPALLGRGALVRTVIQLLESGRDVVVEGSDCLGRDAFQLAVVNELTQSGRWTVCGLDAAFPERDPARGTVVSVELDELTPLHVAKLSAHAGAPALRVLAFRRSSIPFEDAALANEVPRIARAETLQLAPLTRDELDELIAEQSWRDPSRGEPTPAERIALYDYSAGYPHLATTLLCDWGQSSSYDDNFGGYSDAVLAQASAIINDLPPSQQHLLRALSLLVGIQMGRLHQFIDRVDVTRLLARGVISTCFGALTMAPPLRDALHLLPTEPQHEQKVRDAIADICIAHDVGAPYSEDEIILAASALATDPETRSAISEAAQQKVFVAAILLLRQRGARDQSASFARRHMSLFPTETGPFTRALGRSDIDAIRTLEAALSDATDGVAETAWWDFVCALDLPLLSVSPAAVLVVAHARMVADASEHEKFDALLSSMRAAEKVESGDMRSARSLLQQRPALPQEPDIVCVRWLLVESAVHAWQSDHAGLQSAHDKFAALLSQAGGAHRFDRIPSRAAAESMLIMSLCFGVASMPTPPAFDESVFCLFANVVARDDVAATVCLLTTMLLLDTTRKGELAPSRALQYLRSAPATPIAQWVLAKLDGSSAAAGVVRQDGFRFLLLAWQILQAMNIALREGSEEFRAALADLAGIDALPVRIARAYLTVLDRADQIPHALVAAADRSINRLAADSAVRAIATTMRGIVHADPATLLDAVEQLLALGAIEHAKHALAHADALVDDSDRQRLEELSEQVRQRDRNLSDIVLTRREYQVALLAAQGLSNREIGSQLFLSVRTIESHMYRAMRKLLLPRKSLSLTLLTQVSIED